MNRRRTSPAYWISGVILVLAGYLGGLTIGIPPTAEAEVRPTTVPEAFKSGGARSELVLKEIVVTLQRMDTRLANLEKSAGELVTIQREKE